jgi:hypothetical protein
MKTFLLSFVFLAFIHSSFAQTPCVEGIGAGTNMGGGDCRDCNGTPNIPGSDFSKATATVVLDFGDQSLQCIPRLLKLTKTGGLSLQASCGVGKLKAGGGNNGTLVEYCFFGDDDAFFRDRAFVSATISYECGGEAVVRTCVFGNENIPLPVSFKSFNVSRKNISTVGVSWTTASEKDNRGFNVQRNDGSGWKNVAFVFSQSVAGTSSADLSYEYNDANTEKGVSQYRIQQVDLDGRATFSLIRAVRGESTATKLLVYPNPSSTGNVNVVFDNSIGVRDISVSDATGRLVRTFKSVTNSVLLIENLRKGFYTLRVTNRTTAASTVEKVVIK